jgi:membrane protease YdiL (CAAX protease family)
MESTPEQLPVPESRASQSTESLFAGFPTPPAGPETSLSRRIFIGPYGLRAGWSLLIYFAILASIVFTVRGVVEYRKAQAHQAAIAAAKAQGKPAAPATAPKTDPNAPMPALGGMEQEGIAFIAIFLVSLLMALIERRRFTAYGLGGQGSIGRFFVGAIWGFIALSILVGTLRILHLVSLDAQLDHGWPILGWGAADLVVFLFVGMLEEYLFRGYIQFTLTRGMVSLGNRISRTHARTIAFWIATLITSALFFLAHTGNSGEDKLGLFLVFLAGLVFVLALWRTGSLWWGIGFHMAWDWSQSFLYGVPDSGLIIQGRLFSTHPLGDPLFSGGTVGPEGSVLCVPILLLVIVVLFFTRSSAQPRLETKQTADSHGAQPVTLKA